jgi:ectoine hydroxylase-related dioxygenase (phytanoyl-CoA dioxygenase family)
MAAIDIDRHVRELVDDGFTVVEGAMPPEEVQATRRAMDEVLAKEEPIARRFGIQTDDVRSVFNVHAKHPHFYGLALRNPAPLEIARKILGDDLVLDNLTIRIPMPTGRKDAEKLGGHFHVDWDQFTVEPFKGGKHYPMAIQSAWAFSDFTRESGGTVIYPKTHLSLSAPNVQGSLDSLPPGYVYATAPAGSVFLWDSAVWHTGGVNFGTEPRYTVIGYMQRWWIKGYFNDPIRRVSPSALAEMSYEERRLFGLAPRKSPNTFTKDWTEEAIAALSPEERVVMAQPADW